MPTGWPNIYDIRDIKHPFVRRNQRAAAAHEATKARIANLEAQHPEMIALRHHAEEAVEKMAEAIEREADLAPPKKAN